MRNHVFVGRTGESTSLEDRLREALDWLSWERLVPRNSRIFVKPNLTWRVPTPGVTVTPDFLAALAAVLRERSNSVTFGEAEGGYNSYSVEETFQNHGLHRLAQTFGIRAVNLSKLRSEEVRGAIAGKEISVTLPSYLLHEVDVFITVPVPKVHAMTGVSLGYKNQWGCLPGAMRLRNHPQFAHKILLINKALNPQFAIFDGSYFLDRTGPLVGKPIKKNLLIASDNIGAGSIACCKIMGIDPARIAHFRLARREGMFPDPAGIEYSEPVERFCGEPFKLERNIVNWIAYAAFHSSFMTRLIYDSALGDFAHRLLYSVRKTSVARRILYGVTGAPPTEGRRS